MMLTTRTRMALSSTVYTIRPELPSAMARSVTGRSLGADGVALAVRSAATLRSPPTRDYAGIISELRRVLLVCRFGLALRLTARLRSGAILTVNCSRMACGCDPAWSSAACPSASM